MPSADAFMNKDGEMAEMIAVRRFYAEEVENRFTNQTLSLH